MAPVQATDCIGIFSKPENPVVAEVAPALVRWLRQRQYTVELDRCTAQAAGLDGGREDWSGPPPRLAIVLGGDGTLLRVARLLGATSEGAETPLLGVNLGTLGFLTEVPARHLYPSLEAILAGHYREDRRHRIAAAAWRGGDCLWRGDAWNEAVIGKGALARIVEFDLHIDGAEVSAYRADGLIISTATGSTAYSLSAGGPVLDPRVKALVITPICPHTLTNRPLIVRDTARVEVRLRSPAGPIYLTLDGQEGAELAAGDRVTCEQSAHCVNLVRLPEYSFFAVLKNKLKWG
ncbi:MAG: NAD(+)/NADH kinase [Terriglobales bacterium]